MGFVANFIRFQQCKYFENLLRCDKITESLKVGTFLRHSVDSLRLFSQHCSPMPHFGGCTPRGGMTPHSNEAEIFVQCTYPQLSSSCV